MSKILSEYLYSIESISSSAKENKEGNLFIFCNFRYDAWNNGIINAYRQPKTISRIELFTKVYDESIGFAFVQDSSDFPQDTSVKFIIIHKVNYLWGDMWSFSINAEVHFCSIMGGTWGSWQVLI